MYGLPRGLVQDRGTRGLVRLELGTPLLVQRPPVTYGPQVGLGDFDPEG